MARARQRLREIADRRLDPESEQSALVALVATLPESILLPLGAGAPDEPALADWQKQSSRGWAARRLNSGRRRPAILVTTTDESRPCRCWRWRGRQG